MNVAALPNPLGRRECDVVVMELLNAIEELSQSVARMPCPPEDKAEVLENVKTLFSSYHSIANLFATMKDNVSIVEGAGAGSDVGEMQKKMQDMERKLNSMEKKLDSSLNKNPTVADTYILTTDQLKETQNLISERISMIENKSNDFEDLQSQVAQMNRVLSDRLNVRSEQEEDQNEMLKLHQEIANLETLIHNTRGTAFAVKAAPSGHKYTAGETIQFRNVICNMNDCFDQETGIFKNKSLGAYVFTSSINTNSEGNFEVAIVHNGEEVAMFGTPGQKDLQTGTSTVLFLKPGDMVSVNVAAQNILHLSPGVQVGSGFSTFIGYKIF